MIPDELKEEIKRLLIEYVGVNKLEQVLKELADSEEKEENEEIWIQALAILQGQSEKSENH